MPKKMSGIPAIEQGMRYAIWRTAIKREPLAAEAMDKFGCSKPTAHRWAALWRDVNGQPSLARGQNANRTSPR